MQRSSFFYKVAEVAIKNLTLKILQIISAEKVS